MSLRTTVIFNLPGRDDISFGDLRLSFQYALEQTIYVSRNISSIYQCKMLATYHRNGKSITMSFVCGVRVSDSVMVEFSIQEGHWIGDKPFYYDIVDPKDLDTEYIVTMLVQNYLNKHPRILLPTLLDYKGCRKGIEVVGDDTLYLFSGVGLMVSSWSIPRPITRFKLFRRANGDIEFTECRDFGEFMSNRRKKELVDLDVLRFG